MSDGKDDGLPSEREIELLAKLREKEKEVNTLVEDISALRAFLPTQPLPGPSASSQSLPPSLLALLTPLLRANPPSGNASASVLTSRLDLLQRENDELYDVLRESNVGRLREEVNVLRKTVVQLETALKESHEIVSNLSSDLSQAQNALADLAPNPVPLTPASASSGRLISPSTNGTYPNLPASGSASLPPKPIPTGPRSQSSKRERPAAPPPPPPIPRNLSTSTSGLSVRGAAAMSPDLPPRPQAGQKRRSRSRSPIPMERDRDRARERDYDRERDRDGGKRARVERSPPPRRDEGSSAGGNGGGGGGGGSGSRRRHGHGRRSGGPRHGNGSGNGGGSAGPESRSLVERMGL